MEWIGSTLVLLRLRLSSWWSWLAFRAALAGKGALWTTSNPTKACLQLGEQAGSH